MARRRLPAELRSGTSLSFSFQLPILHPPRLAKRKPNTNGTAPSPNPSSAQPEAMPPIRHHKRSSAVELPDVESNAALLIRSKRKNMTAALPLSPRSLNIHLAAVSSSYSASGKSLTSGKLRGRSTRRKKLLAIEESMCMHPEYESAYTPIEPPPLIQLCGAPRSAALELSMEEDLPVVPSQSGGPYEQTQDGELRFLDPYSLELDENAASRFEEMLVRAARSRAQHRERLARRWENLCNFRLRFLRAQAIHNGILAAAGCPPVTCPALFETPPVVPSSSPASSPSESFSAPLTRMSSPSPYAKYGETIDLASATSVDHRNQLSGGASSSDSRPLVDRILECMVEFDYDEICVDGLTEAECRKLRTESRRRRKLDRQRSFELAVLLELKQRQLGRTRSSSSSSESDSISSSDSCSEPSTPPPTPLAVQSMDHLVAKMLMKRHEVSQRPCTSSIATRAAFEARGRSPLRKSIEVSAPTVRARSRSYWTNHSVPDLFSLYGGVFGLGSPAWLKEKQRLTLSDVE